MKKNMWIAFVVIATAVIGSCQNPNKRPHEVHESQLQKITPLSSSNKNAFCVFMCNDEKGMPAISWIERDSMDYKSFYLSRFDKKENEFTTSISIPISQNTAIHEEGMPKVAFKGDGSIFVIYETKEEVENSKWGLTDVKYIQSFDNGETWTSANSIAKEDYKRGKSSSFANLSRLADGEIGVCWLGSAKTEGRPVKFVRTQGEDFGEILTIDEEACQCCRTSIHSSDKGSISIAYRDLLEGSVRDISIAQSFDNGLTFQESIPFSNDNWVVEGCPHAGPSIQTVDESTFVSWFTDAEDNQGVFLAQLDKKGKMIFKKQISKRGHFNHLDVLADETAIIAYNESYQEDNSMYSKIIIAKYKDNQLTQKEITPPLALANFPIIKALNKTEVLVAWVDDYQAYYTIQNINAIEEKVLSNASLATHLIR